MRVHASPRGRRDGDEAPVVATAARQPRSTGKGRRGRGDDGGLGGGGEGADIAGQTLSPLGRSPPACPPPPPPRAAYTVGTSRAGKKGQWRGEENFSVGHGRGGVGRTRLAAVAAAVGESGEGWSGEGAVEREGSRRCGAVAQPQPACPLMGLAALPQQGGGGGGEGGKRGVWPVLKNRHRSNRRGFSPPPTPRTATTAPPSPPPKGRQ